MTKEETIFNQAYLDRYTKEVQLKIAEQIIEDIPDNTDCPCIVCDEHYKLKQQLRDKWLNN